MALLRAVRDRLRFWRWYLTEYIPIAGGAEGDADKDADKDKDAAGADADKDKAGDDDAGKDADADKVEKDDDWQAKARKHERAAKKARKEAEEAAVKLKEREDADKSEQEKAVEKAREEGKAEALTEAEKDRRSDRLEIAVTRLAAKGFEVGEGDDKKTIRFADAEDAQVNIERAIARDDLDAEEIFDSEGKVNADALQTALQELAERKPHLVEDGKPPKPSGDADGGKGTGGEGSGGSKSVEDMSAQEHFERIRRNK